MQLSNTDRMGEQNGGRKEKPAAMKLLSNGEVKERCSYYGSNRLTYDLAK